LAADALLRLGDVVTREPSPEGIDQPQSDKLESTSILTSGEQADFSASSTFTTNPNNDIEALLAMEWPANLLDTMAPEPFGAQLLEWQFGDPYPESNGLSSATLFGGLGQSDDWQASDWRNWHS
jgi:hypothetical protein